MAKYTIDVMIPPSDQESLSQRGSRFDVNNPLGISTHLHCFIVIYLPLMVILTVCQNSFGIWVLKSSFLRNLVLQPMIKVYLLIQCLVMVTGPLYVWLSHVFGFFLTHSQVYPCFLLLWGHNFAVIASSSLLLAITIERAISIGRPEVVWDIWRQACRNITYLLMSTSLVFSVSGLLCLDIETLQAETVYPMCLPWWDNEIGSDVTWNKIVATAFSILPCGATVLCMLLLILREKSYKSQMRTGVSALNHYNAMFVEIKSTLHFKFVRSFLCLNGLFMVTAAPIGTYIVFGPNLQISVNELQPSTDTRNASAHEIWSKGGHGALVKLATSPSSLTKGYAAISAHDMEAILWLIYYTYSLFVIPVFLKTEVLFWREWCGRLRTVSNILRCRRNLFPRWRTMAGLCEDKLGQGHLVGPYLPNLSHAAQEVPFKVQNNLNEVRLTRVQDTELPSVSKSMWIGYSLATNKVLANNSNERKGAAAGTQGKTSKGKLDTTWKAGTLKSEDTSSM